MPITNLALQRRRIKELKEIFKNDSKNGTSILGHYITENYREFTISTKRLKNRFIQILEDNGYSIINIRPCTQDLVFIEVSKYDLEKNSQYVQNVANKYNAKSYWKLNAKLKELRLLNILEELKILKQEKGKLEKQLENLQLSYEIIGIKKEEMTEN